MSLKSKNVVFSPIGVASWLIDNTSLTFDQIGVFCGLYTTEIMAIADGTIYPNIKGVNPILLGILTQEEIEKCQKNKNEKLKNHYVVDDIVKSIKIKTRKYVSRSQRSAKPEAILYCLVFAPSLSTLQIVKLVRTTKNMVETIKNKSYKKYSSLVPKDPVLAGLCTQKEYNEQVAKSREKEENN